MLSPEKNCAEDYDHFENEADDKCATNVLRTVEIPFDLIDHFVTNGQVDYAQGYRDHSLSNLKTQSEV